MSAGLQTANPGGSVHLGRMLFMVERASWKYAGCRPAFLMSINFSTQMGGPHSSALGCYEG